MQELKKAEQLATEAMAANGAAHQDEPAGTNCVMCGVATASLDSRHLVDSMYACAKCDATIPTHIRHQVVAAIKERSQKLELMKKKAAAAPQMIVPSVEELHKLEIKRATLASLLAIELFETARTLTGHTRVLTNPDGTPAGYDLKTLAESVSVQASYVSLITHLDHLVDKALARLPTTVGISKS